MRELGFWLQAKPACLHVLLAANVLVLFFLSWPAGLALQAASLLVALVFVLAYRRVGAS